MISRTLIIFLSILTSVSISLASGTDKTDLEKGAYNETEQNPKQQNNYVTDNNTDLMQSGSMESK